jgi:hypothetical protein
VISGSLFTRDFLLEGIVRTEQWTSLSQEDLDALKRRLTDIARAFLANASPNEAATERDLIYPVLEALGWGDIDVQPGLSPKGRKQVPDALLFQDAQAKARAVADKEPWRRFQHGLAVVECKRWGRLLDRAIAGTAHEGTPAAQMLQYLSRVDVVTGGKVRLGILTNGERWRLYYQGALSVAEDFFEVDLAKTLELPGYEPDLVDKVNERLTPGHALRLFALMFGKWAFLPVEGKRTFHDLSREAGKTWEEKVTQDLSRLVFDDLFPRLITAIAEHDPERPSAIGQPYLEEVRQSALVLLYRLLFVVYAEDRDLLPARREPYKDFSLTALRFEIAERKAAAKVFSARATHYWSKLAAIFKAIAEGDNAFGIPPYNGGLFAKETAALLERTALPDGIVASLVYGLSHTEEEGRPRYINYRDLSVQHLGSVYERTLEYRLKAENGRVVVDADDAARHQSGSYYTPDSLVTLIIEKTVGPLIEERLAAFRAASEELARDRGPKHVRHARLTRLDPAQRILDLKICDPAMGSGHFLVSLVDWLTAKVLAAMGEAQSIATWTDQPYYSPLAVEIDKIRTEIANQAHENGWPYVEDQLEDRHIVRRMVLKRCVYGVDLNPLAVELAKVALWLHSFTVGAPLSFLDHHLRCGNSLLGAWVRPAMDRLVEWGSPLLTDEPRKRALGAATSMQTIERLTDVDVAEVYQSKNLFDSITSVTSDLSDLLTLVHAIEWHATSSKRDKSVVQAWTKGSFGDPVKLAKGQMKLLVPPPPPPETELERKKREITGERRYSEHEIATVIGSWLPDINARFAGGRHLHWQVAFPGIWREWESVELHGGFDAVVGNPPYVRQELIRPLKPALKRAFPDTYDGTADLFVYFFEQGLRLLKPGGRLSYVVTNKWLRAGYAEGLRELFAGRSWIEFIADFGHAKRFFPAADVFPSVVVVRKPLTGEAAAKAPADTDVCVIPRDDVPDKGLDEAVANATYRLPRAHFAKESWTLEPPAVMALLDKIRRNGVPLAEYAGVKPYRGILTGLNEAFLIDAATRDSLVAQEPAAKAIIRPYLRGQDIARWSTPDSGLFMIVMKSSGDHPWPWADAPDETEAERRFKKAYPALHRHFKQYEEFNDPKTGKLRGLRHREDHGRWWWELRPCAYYDAFEKPKIIYQEIQFHPAYARDSENRLSNNKTFILASDRIALMAALNAPLMWWHNWRYLPHMKDEALTPVAFKMEHLPVAPLAGDREAEAAALVRKIARMVRDHHAAASGVRDWLRHEIGIDAPKGALAHAVALGTDDFIAAVRDNLPRSRKLSAAQIADLKREHTATIEPARKVRADIFVLERKLSDLVNAAYGLTPDEVQLMWNTAPPRMPFTPTAFAAPVEPDADENGEEADA